MRVTSDATMSSPEGIEQRVVVGAKLTIAEFGWRGATLERIARASHLSRMTLHRHGLGREEIFALLAEDYAADFRATLLPALSGEGDALTRLRVALAAVCDVTERHLDFLAGLDDEQDARLFHEDSRPVRSREAYVAALHALLEQGMEEGSIRAVDVPETATLLVNATDRTYRHLRAAHDWSPERAAGIVDLVCRGLEPGG